MVSGFETPGPASEFVYPPEIKSEILRSWPDPTLRANWRRKPFGGNALFRQNVAYLSRSFHQGASMTTWLGEKYGWDALMVVFKLVDNLQHKTWKYIDPRWARRDPARRDVARACFEELDRAIGRLLDYADHHRATVLMVSDHGHGSLEGKVQPNLLLRQWGYLALRRGAAQGVTRTRHLWDRLRGKTKRSAAGRDLERDLAVDFSRTRACVMHAGMAGFLYINLEGRQPTGIVKQGDYDALRAELKDRFLGPECCVRGRNGDSVQLFAEVHKPEELYGCSRRDRPWLPDLLLTPHRSLAVIRKIRGAKPVRWLSYRRIEGTHRPEGVIIAGGPGIAVNPSVEAHIVDCAPTILAMLGLGVPGDMEGRVLTEIFREPPVVETAEVSTAAAKGGDDGVYSEADLQQITERLSDLGYLE